MNISLVMNAFIGISNILVRVLSLRLGFAKFQAAVGTVLLLDAHLTRYCAGQVRLTHLRSSHRASHRLETNGLTLLRGGSRWFG